MGVRLVPTDFSFVCGSKQMSFGKSCSACLGRFLNQWCTSIQVAVPFNCIVSIISQVARIPNALATHTLLNIEPPT